MTQAYTLLSANDMPETAMASAWACKVESNSSVKSLLKQRKQNFSILLS